MKLNEKIITARKRKGMSQIDLADAMGVSRQSVSKWETGESHPDIGKLTVLAKELNVSTDWLLTEEETDANDEPAKISANATKAYPEWIYQLPRFATGFIQKYGWFYGVYIALSGAVFAGFGLVIRNVSYHAIFGNGDDIFFADINRKAWSGFSTISALAIGAGIVLVIVGTVVAIALRKYGKKAEK